MMTGRILLATVALATLSGCAAVRSVDPGVDRFRAGSMGAIAAPLNDLNIRRDIIPEVLIEARYRPYGVAGLVRCELLDAEIARLDEALGPDLDSPAARGLRRDEQVADAALDLMRDAMTDFIPMRSWVRRLTGAEAHSREVQRAIRAGLARRSFLKGFGQAQDCAPPAASHGFRPRGIRIPAPPRPAALAAPPFAPRSTP